MAPGSLFWRAQAAKVSTAVADWRRGAKGKQKHVAGLALCQMQPISWLQSAVQRLIKMSRRG